MPEDAPTPEQVLARAIRYHRAERLHITARQLAERVADLGGNLTRQAISKIETESRGVSVDELMILAKALGMAPLLLLFPVGTRSERISGEMEVLPGQAMDVWAAAQWFTGEAHFAEDVATHWAVPLYLFREHKRVVEEYQAILGGRLFAPTPEDPDRNRQRLAADAKLRRLRDVRGEMRRHGLTPPELAENLRHIDERQLVYLDPWPGPNFDDDQEKER